jgi:hypothetical protein
MLKEVTLAIGASVPTTKEDPVGEEELRLPEPAVVTPLQPPRKMAPAVNARIEGR